MTGCTPVKLDLPDDDYCGSDQLPYSTMERDFQRANALITQLFGNACDDRSVRFSRAGMSTMDFPMDLEDNKWWISIAMDGSDIRSSNEMLHHGGCLMVSFPQRLWSHCMDAVALGGADPKKRGSVQYLIMNRTELFPHQLRREAADRLQDSQDAFRSDDILIDLSCANSSDQRSKVRRFCNSDDMCLSYPDLLRQVDIRAVRVALRGGHLLTGVAQWSDVTCDFTASIDPSTTTDMAVVVSRELGDYNRLFVEPSMVLVPRATPHLLEMNNYLAVNAKLLTVKELELAYVRMGHARLNPPLPCSNAERSTLPDGFILCNHVSRQPIATQGRRFTYTMDVLNAVVLGGASPFVMHLVAEFGTIDQCHQAGEVVRVGSVYYVAHRFFHRHLLFDSPELWFFFCRHRSANPQLWATMQYEDAVTITSRVEALTDNRDLRYNRELYQYEFRRMVPLRRGEMEHTEQLLQDISQFMMARAPQSSLKNDIFLPKFRLCESDFHILLSKCGRSTAEHHKELFYSCYIKPRQSVEGSPVRDDPPSATESAAERRSSVKPVTIAPDSFKKQLVIIQTSSEEIKNKASKSRKRKSMERSQPQAAEPTAVHVVCPKSIAPTPATIMAVDGATTIGAEPSSDVLLPVLDVTPNTDGDVRGALSTVHTPVLNFHDYSPSPKIQRTDDVSVEMFVNTPTLVVPAVETKVFDAEQCTQSHTPSDGVMDTTTVDNNTGYAVAGEFVHQPVGAVTPQHSTAVAFMASSAIDPANVSSCSYSAASYAGDCDATQSSGDLSSTVAMDDSVSAQQMVWPQVPLHASIEDWCDANSSSSMMPPAAPQQQLQQQQQQNHQYQQQQQQYQQQQQQPSDLQQMSYNNAGVMLLLAQQCDDRQMANMARDASSSMGNLGSLLPAYQQAPQFDLRTYEDTVNRLLDSQRQTKSVIVRLENNIAFLTQIISEQESRLAQAEQRLNGSVGA